MGARVGITGRYRARAEEAQSMGKIDFDDLMGERKYPGQTAYNQSKLANVMFTYELIGWQGRASPPRRCIPA